MSSSCVTKPSSSNLLRGGARIKELAAEAAVEREAIAAALLADLGRPPSAVDRIACQNLAALHVKASKLESNGRNATEVRRQICQQLRAAGFKPAPATVPAPLTVPELLRLRGYTAPVAHDEQADKAAAEVAQ